MAVVIKEDKHHIRTNTDSNMSFPRALVNELRKFKLPVVDRHGADITIGHYIHLYFAGGAPKPDDRSIYVAIEDTSTMTIEAWVEAEKNRRLFAVCAVSYDRDSRIFDDESDDESDDDSVSEECKVSQLMSVIVKFFVGDRVTRIDDTDVCLEATSDEFIPGDVLNLIERLVKVNELAASASPQA